MILLMTLQIFAKNFFKLFEDIKKIVMQLALLRHYELSFIVEGGFKEINLLRLKSEFLCAMLRY